MQRRIHACIDRPVLSLEQIKKMKISENILINDLITNDVNMDFDTFQTT